MLSDLHLGQTQLHDEEIRAARRRLLVAERDAVIQAVHKGLRDADQSASLIADIDARLEQADLPAVAEAEVVSPPPAS